MTKRVSSYARNAKMHGPDQVAKIAASMAQFGWTVPCMVAALRLVCLGSGARIARRLERAPRAVARVHLPLQSPAAKAAQDGASKHAGETLGGGGLRTTDGQVRAKTSTGNAIQSHRIPDSVFRIMRHKGGLGAAGSHPAVFPVALVEAVLEAFTDPGDLIFTVSSSFQIGKYFLGRRSPASSACRRRPMLPSVSKITAEYGFSAQVLWVSSGL